MRLLSFLLLGEEASGPDVAEQLNIHSLSPITEEAKAKNLLSSKVFCDGFNRTKE